MLAVTFFNLPNKHVLRLCQLTNSFLALAGDKLMTNYCAAVLSLQ